MGGKEGPRAKMKGCSFASKSIFPPSHRPAAPTHAIRDDVHIHPPSAHRVRIHQSLSILLLHFHVLLIAGLYVSVGDTRRKGHAVASGVRVGEEHQTIFHPIANADPDPRVARRGGEVEVEVARALVCVEREDEFGVSLAIVHEDGARAIGVGVGVGRVGGRALIGRLLRGGSLGGGETEEYRQEGEEEEGEHFQQQ